jgi:hypothetical protein
MAEPRRQQDQMYVDRTGTEDVRGQALVDNEDRSIPNTTKPQPVPASSPTALFSTEDVADLRTRWGSVQAGFVDEPRRAVQEADKLVATAVDRITDGFARERSSLETQWGRGDEVSTEDLRLTLQRYHAFFDRLLNV